LFSPFIFLTLSFFYHHPTPSHIYTLSLHDALPIYPDLPSIARHVRLGLRARADGHVRSSTRTIQPKRAASSAGRAPRSQCGGRRSEEHTSELQSHLNLVCRLLLEKKKKKNKYYI